MRALDYSFPADELEFDRMFSTEEACEDYLYAHKWPQGFVCSECGHTHAWKTQRRLHVCSSCGFNNSLTTGTIMENTHKSLKHWFKAIWLYTTRKSGLSAKDLERLLGVTYQTAWAWMQKLRKASVVPQREKLEGTVEIDEFYYGGYHQGKAGRGSENKTAVIVAVERETKIISSGKKKGLPKEVIGRVRMQVIEDCSKEKLESFIKENVKPGSSVRTDGWASYSGLNDIGYVHAQVNDLTHVDRVISLFKRHMLGTYHGRPEHKYLKQYLEEFTFRFNRKAAKEVGLIFQRGIWLTTVVGYMTTAQIVKLFT